MLSRFGALVEQASWRSWKTTRAYLSRRVQVRLACRKYVLHAFQKKSKSGIQTPRAEIKVIKSRLKRAEEEHIRARRFIQTPAAHILRIDQPKISRLLRGQLSGFSTERIMHFLTLLGRDVEITVKPAPRSHRQGHLRIVATG
jgi:predicted XRE-type DNA-binding protein